MESHRRHPLFAAGPPLRRRPAGGAPARAARAAAEGGMAGAGGPVFLRITDTADGRTATILVPRRERAEAIVSVGLGLHWPRYVYEIDP
jgi:hypothetical protein